MFPSPDSVPFTSLPSTSVSATLRRSSGGGGRSGVRPALSLDATSPGPESEPRHGGRAVPGRGRRAKRSVRIRRSRTPPPARRDTRTEDRCSSSARPRLGVGEIGRDLRAHRPCLHARPQRPSRARRPTARPARTRRPQNRPSRPARPVTLTGGGLGYFDMTKT